VEDVGCFVDGVCASSDNGPLFFCEDTDLSMWKMERDTHAALAKAGLVLITLVAQNWSQLKIKTQNDFHAISWFQLRIDVILASHVRVHWFVRSDTDRCRTQTFNMCNITSPVPNIQSPSIPSQKSPKHLLSRVLSFYRTITIINHVV